MGLITPASLCPSFWAMSMCIWPVFSFQSCATITIIKNENGVCAVHAPKIVYKLFSARLCGLYIACGSQSISNRAGIILLLYGTRHSCAAVHFALTHIIISPAFGVGFVFVCEIRVEDDRHQSHQTTDHRRSVAKDVCVKVFGHAGVWPLATSKKVVKEFCSNK